MWVGVTTSFVTPQFPYTFTETFDLTGYNPSTAALSGFFVIDDEGYVALNGNQLLYINWGNFNFIPFSAVSSDFVPGINTLTVTMTNDNYAADGMRLLITNNAVTVNSSTPEPTTLVLLASGLVGGIVRRMRSR
jgi:hypothetical protein